MKGYCTNCKQMAHAKQIRRPAEMHEVPGMKSEWVSDCCGEPMTEDEPEQKLPYDGKSAPAIAALIWLEAKATIRRNQDSDIIAWMSVRRAKQIRTLSSLEKLTKAISDMIEKGNHDTKGI